MPAKGDAVVRNSCTVNPEEVWVLGHDDTTLRPGELDVLFVPSTTQACLDGRGHVDSTPAKSVGDRRSMCSSRWKRSIVIIPGSQFSHELGGDGAAHLGDQILLSLIRRSNSSR